MSRARGPRIAVVGGGLTGLTAAYRLQKAGMQVQVFERSDAVGGRTRTIRRDGFVFDVGAITMLPTYRAILGLAAELGIGDQLHRVPPVIGIPKAGEIHRLEIAHPLRAMMSTRLLSTRSKLRMLRLLKPLSAAWGRINYVSMAGLAPWGHETVADHVARELDEEIHQYVAGPIIRGNTLNSTACAPFGELLWMLRQYAQPYVYGFAPGINYLAEMLAAAVPVQFDTTVTRIVRDGGDVVVHGERDGRPFTERFDGGVVGLPPVALEGVVPDLDPRQRAFLRRIKPLPSINVHLGLAGELDRQETFILPPECEQPDLTTLVLDHLKAPGRAPPGKSLLSLFCRDTWAVEHAALSDDALIRRVLQMAEPYVGDLSARVETAIVQRWSYSIIKSEVGLYDGMVDYESAIDADSPLQIGSEFLSLGMEAAVCSGERMAANLRRTLSA